MICTRARLAAFRSLRAFAATSSLSLMLAGSASAQVTTVSNEQGKLKQAQENVTALGPELLGDQVNLYNGALEFVQTDSSLPGNNALPVAITRRQTAGRTVWIRTTMGDWDLELPRISGTFSSSEGWVNAKGATNRCSNYSPPATVFRPASGTGGGDLRALGVKPPVGPSRQGISPLGAWADSSNGNNAVGSRNAVEFTAHEYWQGNLLTIAGGASEEVLLRSAANTAAPTDGQSWPLVTRGHWQIRCLPALQNAAGEGFIAKSPEGVTYRFDWLATDFQPSLKMEGALLGRVRVNLYATLVTDRFGNSVTYSFDSSSADRLVKIQASDGRRIDLSYDGQGRVQSASDGTRVFGYSYSSTGELYRVTRPDASYWEFNLRPLVHLYQNELGEGASCNFPGSFPEGLYTGTVRHPSGAIGTFVTRYVYHPRVNVNRWCIYVPNGTAPKEVGAVIPKVMVSQSLVEKTIAGPGLPARGAAGAMTWRHAYDESVQSGWAPCGNCQASKTQVVTGPAQDTVRHTYGISYGLDEGQLLTKAEFAFGAQVALRTTRMHYRQPGGMPYPEPAGDSIQLAGDYLASRHRPEDQRRIEQQGNTFTWQVDASPGFDRFAKPTKVTKFSTLGDSRTETTAYNDNLGLWVLSQVESISAPQSPQPMESHEYFSATAQLMSSSRFGKKMQSFEYNSDGTVKTIKDAADRGTSLQSWVRGSPQLIIPPDSSRMSQAINNLGEPSYHIDQVGLQTSYDYDTMGRLRQITYPPDSNVAGGAYRPTQQTFTQVNGDEFGLGAGHWKQTLTRGNAVTVRLFDALWRSRVEQRYDAANPSGTLSYLETRYDAVGRKSFESYPQRNFTGVDGRVAGTSYGYDALDRLVQQTASSELGDLITVNQYPSNVFSRITTNPRGFATTFGFQAFDTPSEDSIRSIQAPEGVQVSIVRDVFGKPNSITRGGTSSAGLYSSVTRSYTYDAYQRLCKTIEPETGATQQDYDQANNVAWRASGLAAQSGACNAGNAPLARRISFGYDVLNRPIATTHGDGSPGVTRSYWPDGLPRTISTPTSTWTLDYSPLRKLQSETLSAPGLGSYSFSYGFDANGSVASMTYPGGPTLQYSPDALGRPTAVPGYLSDASYYPNGQLASYNGANRVNYTASQNTRLLPSSMTYGNVSAETYRYDANGNVDAISGANARAMGYDGLDRLTAANGIWGQGRYSYDTVDNIRSSAVGTRGLTHYYDGSNRLYAVRGSLNVDATYDANGNVSRRDTQGFAFDIANRLVTEALPSSNPQLTRFHYYDGLGRRAYSESYRPGQPLQTTIRLYGQAGQLLMSIDSIKGVTQHFYLGSKLIAEYNSQTLAPWVHADALGSPVANTNGNGGLIDRTYYEPYGLPTANGSNPDGIGFTGHVNDVATGLVYMQQRYYDPIAGRFLSVDPVTAHGGTGGNFSRYAYVNNNPYKFIDPDGRLEDCTGSHIKCETGGLATGFSGSVSGQIYDTESRKSSLAQSTAGNAPNGRDPYDRHTEGVRNQAQLLRAEGFEILGFEVPAKVDGVEGSRRYDIVVRKDTRVFGVEVKTSLNGVFQLKGEQVKFDVRTVEIGAITVSTPRITGVMYRGECVGCGLDSIYRSWVLVNKLSESGVTFQVTP